MRNLRRHARADQRATRSACCSIAGPTSRARSLVHGPRRPAAGDRPDPTVGRLQGGRADADAARRRGRSPSTARSTTGRALRRELEAKGWRFETPTDTEVVLCAYLEWGPACLDRFNGMFAIAIWHDDRLFLARDRLGKKPLFYTHGARGLGFASELKVLPRARLRGGADLPGARVLLRRAHAVPQRAERAPRRVPALDAARQPTSCGATLVDASRSSSTSIDDEDRAVDAVPRRSSATPAPSARSPTSR